MTDETGNNSFRGRGLFAKYVFSLVGLVLFVLAVNSAIETYFVYRETQSALVDAMAEKAETTVSRIQQFVDETERQISWVTAGSRKPEQRRDLCLAALNSIDGLTCRTPDGAFYLFPSCSGMIGRSGPLLALVEASELTATTRTSANAFAPSR